MASKRAKRRKACDGKQRHPSKQDANDHLWHLVKTQNAHGLRPYKCPFCGGWHVGHKSLTTKTETK